MQVLQARQRRIGSPRADFLDPLRIGDQRAAERDKIGLAARHRRFRGRRIAEAADRDDRHADVLFHVGGEIEKGRVRQAHRRQHDLRRGQRAIMPGGDVQRVGAGRRGPDRDLPAFAIGQPAGKEILDRQPINHAEARHRRLHRAQHIEPEAGAVFERAAIVVGAAVFERRVKLRNQIAVRGVNFDAIEAGLLRALCGGDIGGRRRGDARLGHLLRNDGLERRFIDRMRNCRRRDRRFAADVDAGMAAAMAELDRGLGAAAMDFPDQPRQAGNEAIVIDADLVAAMPAALFRRRHFHGDQPGAAAHPRHVIGDAVVGDEAFGVRRARRHRRHDDAVFDFDRPDTGRSEEDVASLRQLAVSGISPPSRSMVAPCIQVARAANDEGDRDRRRPRRCRSG